jgi:hypothetical protein
MMSSIPGLFAAGDVRARRTPGHDAVGDATATIAALKYIAELKSSSPLASPGSSHSPTESSPKLLPSSRTPKLDAVIASGEEAPLFLAGAPRGLALRAIWLTHAHLDHVAVAQVRRGPVCPPGRPRAVRRGARQARMFGSARRATATDEALAGRADRGPPFAVCEYSPATSPSWATASRWS